MITPEYGRSGTSRMTRRKLFGGVALSGFALSSVGTASTSLAPAPAAGLARLSLNENPLGPSPLAVQAIQNALTEIARYAGDDARALEQQIADREGVLPDQIILGEILDSLGLQLALDGGAGGEFIYSEPGYTALVDAVAPGGGVVVGVPLNAHLENDLPAIAARVTARTRAIYIVNPHNPGTASEAVPFEAFLTEMAERTTVIVDEAYLEFEPDFVQKTAVELTRGGANVVVFRTFGKIYGPAGMPIGYAVAPKRIADSLKRNGLGAAHSQNRLTLTAAAASLLETGYVDRMRLKVIGEREKWHAMLDAIGRRRSDSRGNFVFFETGQPHEVIATQLMNEGIEIARAFPPFDHWVRISIGLPRKICAHATRSKNVSGEKTSMVAGASERALDPTAAILFLASDEASYITGVILPVAGGDLG
jgi:histidinol-phosphate aminotransferase